MGDMLRSSDMMFCDIYLQPEAAFQILSQLGEMACVQFKDMNGEVQAFQRNYISDVCRCDEMERKLRYMETEMLKDNIYIPQLTTHPKAMQPNEMTMYENMLEKWENDITEMSENQTGLLKSYLELNEMYYVLHHIGPLLGDAELRQEQILSRKSGAGDTVLGGCLVVMTGVIRRNISFHFEMMLWRISRGNIYYRQAREDKILKDPYTGQKIRKVAFLAVCHGEQLSSRMSKVFLGFRVNTYICPRTVEERMEMINKLKIRISDLEQVMTETKYQRCKTLRAIGKQWHLWMGQIRKAKSIYHVMNLFNLDVTKKCLLGQCWVPDRDLQKVQDTLESCSETIGTTVPSFLSKSTTLSVTPTFHRTNKFTEAFQALINAYGHSTYKELNPGLYTIATFPFLFALMFGDMGHAVILIVFSVWMVVNEKTFSKSKSTNEIWNIIFGGRYVILLLGLFSVYTGFIYNDTFGKGLCWMHSHWRNGFTKEQLTKNSMHELDPRVHTKTPYIFGMDPALMLATNSIILENSIKMKISIIVGIVHMMFGITLSLFNYIYFKRYYSICLRFIPELLFLSCIFFWLVILIYIKWFKYNSKADMKIGPNCAPHILVLFIDMILLSTSKAANDECDAYLFPSQKLLQNILLLIAGLCVPVLIFGTPIYTYRYNKKMRSKILQKISNFRSYQHMSSDLKTEEFMKAELARYNVSFGDLMIEQMIHSIEFLLGTISHTASYLRLWALSLAHSQLSEMLWHMVFSKLALRDHTIVGCLKIFVIFAIWAVFTVSILVVMEGLSAFLHTLRLHWMEFMSKFYSGNGYPFQPFSFKDMLETEENVNDASKRT